ncbi:hypothetical protein E2C01_082278 [Portunus trituberculatus]|uniref:Uncharacterized protein n=1 Tax=Portunus trituberculatus TaxID=210409 RepID=A0A5B7J162_PORTR|nr:hypothetical protein [Portunus trituberculatus]
MSFLLQSLVSPPPPSWQRAADSPGTPRPYIPEPPPSFLKRLEEILASGFGISRPFDILW